MGKPCGHEHFVETCRICFWCEDCSQKGQQYRELWGVPGPNCGPGMVRRVWNFAKAARAHVATGVKKATLEKQQARLALCVVCEYYRSSNATCKHASCGCFVAMKSQWDEQKCPIGKW
jgi:hypothetical protein